MTLYEWSYGLPVQTDIVNYEWSFGSPYIISQYSGVTQTLAITISADTTVTLPMGLIYKIDGTVDVISTVLSALHLLVNIPFEMEINAGSYIGDYSVTSQGFNLDGFNAPFNTVDERYTIQLDAIHAFALEIGAETTVLDELEIIVPFVIDAVTTVLDTLGITRNFEIEINGISGDPPMGVLGVNQFGAFIFGPSHTHYPLSVTRGLTLEIDSITTITELASQIRGLFLTTEGDTWVYLDSSGAVTSPFDITLNSLSDVIFTLHVEQGYPLRVRLTTTKRQTGMSTTKRMVALSVDR